MVRKRYDAPGRARPCARCLLRPDWCLCDVVPTLAPRTALVLVRHTSERFRPSNSGRLAALAIPGLTLVEHGSGEQVVQAALDEALRQATSRGARLLWPEGPPLRAGSEDSPGCLVILDATWSQARRMRQRIAGLRALPTVSLGAAPVARVERLRRSPEPDRLSTLEALAQALRVLEGEQMSGPLEALYGELCARALPERHRASGGH